MKITTTVVALAAFISIKSQTNPNNSFINLKMYKAQQYLTGIGELKNVGTAFLFYLRCAELGKSQAMTMVGTMFKNGIGAESNQEKAIEWFTKAGEAGNANGWYLFGDMYKNVLQEQQDYYKAFT